MKRNQRKKYKIGTYKINKISLSCVDNKRFALDDGIHKLAYFHKDLRTQIITDDHKEEEIEKDSLKKKEILTYKKDSKRFS